MAASRAEQLCGGRRATSVVVWVVVAWEFGREGVLERQMSFGMYQRGRLSATMRHRRYATKITVIPSSRALQYY